MRNVCKGREGRGYNLERAESTSKDRAVPVGDWGWMSDAAGDEATEEGDSWPLRS